MNNPNSDSGLLISNPEDPHNSHHHPRSDENDASAATVRQNIAAETRLNLNFSFKYNVIVLLIAVSKIIAALLVLIHVPNLCYGPKQMWIICVMVYDFFYIIFICVTMKNILSMNRVIRRHVSSLSYNSELNSDSDRIDPSFYPDSSDHESEEVREYDVEPSHRDVRVASLSSSMARRRRTIEKVRKLFDSVYLVIFIIGQCLYFLFKEGHCDTPATDKLIMVFIILGYLWILTPVLIVLLGCLCLPVLLLCIYIFARGDQIPASKNDLSQLEVKKYSGDIIGNKECVICMLDYHEGDDIIQLKCNQMHHFHETCIKRWLKINGECPVCRTRLQDMRNIQPINPEAVAQDAEHNL